MYLFHYHLVTSRIRETEERYLAKLGFALVARHGRVGEKPVSYGLDAEEGSVKVADTAITFLPGGPEGRPVLDAERFE